MPYSEMLLIPMRQDLTRFGVVETRTPESLDQELAANKTVLLVVNSVCGCAAGKARPAVGMALQNSIRPDKTVTVFAGGDEAATAHARALLKDYPPSSPSMAIFREGKPVFMLHRHQIETRQADEIADILEAAFEQHCQ
ncbi:MAG: BrxA/BrxB family bacilliredoxin [Acidobacteria bacterium]|nr:BrxA/BrxB family bacilliredoxin [Acidobacteriota bacterium]